MMSLFSGLLLSVSFLVCGSAKLREELKRSKYIRCHQLACKSVTQVHHSLLEKLAA
ncbi:hypothetical protein Bca101_097784 [Brassica carinata]